MVRNLNHDTFLVIRYVKRRLTVLIDIDGKHEWRDCIDVPGVRLPRGYYFGTSSVTGDLSALGSQTLGLRMCQCGVVEPPTPPGTCQLGFGALGSPGAHGLFFFLCHAVEASLEPMSGLALFLIVFFSLVAIVFAIVIGIIIYNKWQEQSRKHFY
ncbi:LMA2L protein, partial [Corythaeola cristata]|nr:LMA2L protein [Corythaeola cristata]